MSESGSNDGWSRLPDYPEKRGVAGVLAGTHHGVLIAAGGANFPESPPWDGGVKKYYSEIHVWSATWEAWQPGGCLPAPRGYAAVVSLPDGVLVLGGENGDEVFADTLWLRWHGEKVVTSPGPALPAAMSNAVAVVSGEFVYLASGYGGAKHRTTFGGFWRWAWRDAAAEWQTLPGWPGPSRAQAVMAAVAGDILLCSGIELASEPSGNGNVTYLVDGYRYSPKAGWQRLPDMPHSAVAAPSPAPVQPQPARVYVLGGVDGRMVGKLPRETRVPDEILYFDLKTETWCTREGAWPNPVVTTPAVPMEECWYFVSGEISAGVRTPQVWSWNLAALPVGSTSSPSL